MIAAYGWRRVAGERRLEFPRKRGLEDPLLRLGSVALSMLVTACGGTARVSERSAAETGADARPATTANAESSGGTGGNLMGATGGHAQDAAATGGEGALPTEDGAVPGGGAFAVDASPSPQCKPEYCPTGGGGTPCCVSTDGTCGNDFGSGCVSNTPASSSCDPASCPYHGTAPTCCTRGYCALDWGLGCGVEPRYPDTCVGAQEMCELQSKTSRSCECSCFACLAEWNYCVNDTDYACYYIMICESAANCAGADCYRPETCQKVIDSYGGPTSNSAEMAEVMNNCVVKSGCALGLTAPADRGAR